MQLRVVRGNTDEIAFTFPALTPRNKGAFLQSMNRPGKGRVDLASLKIEAAVTVDESRRRRAHNEWMTFARQDLRCCARSNGPCTDCVIAIQRSARFALLYEALGLHPLASIIHLALVKAKHADVVAHIADAVVGEHGRVVPLGAHAIEGTVAVLWNFAHDLFPGAESVTLDCGSIYGLTAARPHVLSD